VAPRASGVAGDLDTGTIERVPECSTRSTTPRPSRTSTERLPCPPRNTVDGGKRRADKHAGRNPLLKGFRRPVLMGVAALAVSVGGVVTVNDASPASSSDTTASATAASAPAAPAAPAR
jgi:hypothetical protein